MTIDHVTAAGAVARYQSFAPHEVQLSPGTPPFEFAARRGEKNQEHCTVYNMMRLAECLFRWTCDATYLDYYESNAVNGVLAQQNPDTGMVAYFLPLEGGARKHWGSPTYDFWCCHGTLVQAHTRHNEAVFYGDGSDTVVVARFVDSVLTTSIAGAPVEVAMQLRDTTLAASPVAGTPAIAVDGQSGPVKVEDGFVVLERTWSDSTIDLTLPTTLRTAAIPDEAGTVAFLDGPVVLAGECDHEPTLTGDPSEPAALLVPDDERQWGEWLRTYRTIGQPRSIRFRPLNEIVDQPYTVYFPVT